MQPSHDVYGGKGPCIGRVSVFVVVLNSYYHTIVVAAAAIRGHLSAASLDTGPLIPDHFVSPCSFVRTAALSSNWTIVPSALR